MEKIFFTKDIAGLLKTQFNSDFGDDTVVTYHAMYDKPEVKAKKVIEWEKYKVTYSTLEPDRVVLIGLNRMIVPSNRCDFIHAYLTVMNPALPKIVIDTDPFIGEPWRLYFHYQLVNRFEKFGANYSYPIEGEWSRWFERDVDECKFSPQNLKDAIVDTWTDLPKLATFFELYAPGASDVEWYDEVRKVEFEKFRTAKLTINALLKASNGHFGLDLGYDSYRTGRAFKVPGVGVYRFMVEENRRRQDIYNLFTIS